MAPSKPKELTDQEYSKIVEDALNEAWEIIHSDDSTWKQEKKNDHGDIVMSKKNKKGKKIYRVRAKIDCPADKLIAKLRSTEDITKWNTTLTKHEILKKLSDDVCISYQITTEGGGGVVSARDFIFLYKNEMRGDTFIQGGCSIEYPGPKSSKIVRAWNGPGAQMVRPYPGDPTCCEFVWLMDCEYRGWIPSSILDIAMPHAQMQFVECVRQAVNV